MTLHEAVDAHTASEHFFDIERIGLATTHAITQPIGGLPEVFHGLTDFILPLAVSRSAAIEGSVEALVEPLRLLPNLLQQLLDPLVVDPVGRFCEAAFQLQVMP